MYPADIVLVAAAAHFCLKKKKIKVTHIIQVGISISLNDA